MAFDLVATFVFGLTGAVAAVRRGFDVIGLFALTFSLTACEDPTGITGGDDDSDSDSAAGPGG